MTNDHVTFTFNLVVLGHSQHIYVIFRERVELWADIFKDLMVQNFTARAAYRATPVIEEHVFPASQYVTYRKAGNILCYIN